MRKIAIPLAAVLLSYVAYIMALPGDGAVSAAVDVSGSRRVSEKLVVPDRSVYAVSLGDHLTEGDARISGAAYALRGAAAVTTGSEGHYHVLCAMYETEAEASAACRALRISEDLSATIHPICINGAEIMVNAREDQFIALTAAIEMLENSPFELNEIAARIDRGRCDTSTARTLAAVENTDIGRVCAQLSTAVDGSEDRFCRSLLAVCQELNESIALAASDDGPAGLALSSAIRQSCIDAVRGFAEIMSEF